MKRRDIVVLILSVVVVLGLCGCAGPEAKSPSEELGPIKQVEESFPEIPVWQGTQFTDIFVPPSFRMLAEESFIYSTEADVRLAEVKYEGEIKIPEIIRLYQERMPANGWIFKQISGAREKTLTYRKATEECNITLKVKGGKTFIMVMVHPTG